ncbi:hypothetical protein DMB92_02135 [Campylobacter sp. MIT 99-7217]|uniref:hypothetical protein n=1 Tax=Campylobacter sp. MIT 99-7217 TaxID=535091 RepID=UPI00115BC183|nr:hypothetical protein [Campylobacter sp. MIT 99-7217]TQR33708.1 hypothetical protein DMB92_02135 [Campylobacter sp. MIT 99-7217]
MSIERIVILLVVLLAIGFAVAIFLTLKKQTQTSQDSTKHKPEHKSLSLDDLISMAQTASDDKLHDLILTFVNTQKLGSRTNAKSISKDAKKKLDFVTAVSSNSHSEAKNIAFLNRELSKRYPSYKKEIDAYEQMGLAKRKIRQG